ncbi:HD domain-containing protein [Chitinophaga vietnamensis]|uniref:HD domain-containing protein n=1 Tax=Chitinophaga vietnamensis TaxID=2593957 RepID=UPI0011782585|nr:HDIG domain-containing metalloprotein [Chitinophaga vietnamensis]
MNNQALQVVNEIFTLYETLGHHEYGENVSMLMHMMQAALIAESAGFDDEMVLAAFLHDIGHFFENEDQMEGYGTRAHDHLGAKYLTERGFPERMVMLVASHVAAKRYLTYTDSAYYDTLSEASKKTLEHQGGPMTEAEAITFRNDPLFEEYIQLRIWDDMGKETDVPVLAEDIERMRGKALRYLEEHATFVH